MHIPITARSTGVFIAFKDYDLSDRSLTVVIQKRSDTNQDNLPQSLPGAFQPTAAMKSTDLTELTLPKKDSFPPINNQDRKLLLLAIEKECGHQVSNLISEIIACNIESMAGNFDEPLKLLLDTVNSKGRWVRTLGVLLPEGTKRGEFEKLLVRPVEVREFAFITEDRTSEIRRFKDNEKLPIQHGGSGVPVDDIAGFDDDCEALKLAFKAFS